MKHWLSGNTTSQNWLTTKGDLDFAATGLLENPFAMEAIFFATDSSTSKALAEISAMDTLYNTYLTFIEKATKVLHNYWPVMIKSPDEHDVQQRLATKLCDEWDDVRSTLPASDEYDTMLAVLKKWRGNRIRLRADLKDEAVKTAEMELVAKWQHGGEYVTRWSRCLNAIDALIDFWNGELKKPMNAMQSQWKREGVELFQRGLDFVIKACNWIGGNAASGTLRLNTKKSYGLGDESKTYNSNDDPFGEIGEHGLSTEVTGGYSPRF